MRPVFWMIALWNPAPILKSPLALLLKLFAMLAAVKRLFNSGDLHDH